MADFDAVLLEPYHYICQKPGKGIRIELVDAFNHWLKIPKDKEIKIKELVQMLHNASLIIDDIEDNSKLRRGIPVAHSVFGIPQTINAANYVYFQALDKTLALSNVEGVRIFSKQLLELHRGQGKELYWRDSGVCPTEEEYMEMIKEKTGGLFKLAIDLMQLFSTYKSNLYQLVEYLGLYFQIRDDFCNLHSTDYADNKGFCEDLTEGKFSFPIIHGIRANPKSQQLVSILRQKTTDLDLKKYFVTCLHQSGSFEYTKQVLTKLKQQSLDEIEKLGGNPHLVAIISKLSEEH